MLSVSVLSGSLPQALTAETIFGLLICDRHKRHPIGGWLMFFYWQVYAGILVSLVLFAFNIQSYVPENFASTSRFALSLTTVLPSLILILVQCAVATFFLSVRTWDMLRLLRWVIIANLAFTVLGTAIDAKYFPDNVWLGFANLISTSIWLAYFFRSTRVLHVFYFHDWDAAAEKIYPSKPSMPLIT